MKPDFLKWRFNSGVSHKSEIADLRRSIDKRILNNFKPKKDGLDPLRMDYLVGLWFLGYDVGSKEAEAAVKAELGPAPSPEEYVAAVKKAKATCARCRGTGQYVTGVLNGRLTGPGGPCYRCGGKGYQKWTDGKRNHFADSYGY